MSCFEMCYLTIFFSATRSDTKVPCIKEIFHLLSDQQWDIVYTVIMITIVTLKGAVRDFFTISSLRHKPPPTCTLMWSGCNHVQITCNTSSAYHVQRIMLCATWYEGTAQLLTLTEFKSHFWSFILLAEPLTDEGGEETRVPVENPWQRASENATY